jgi:hypothetical protein
MHSQREADGFQNSEVAMYHELHLWETSKSPDKYVLPEVPTTNHQHLYCELQTYKTKEFLKFIQDQNYHKTCST